MKPAPQAAAVGPAPERFVLTLPAAEAALLSRVYRTAGVILEYGSGGSTFVAAELARKAVYSVESDAAWAKVIARSLAHRFPEKPVLIHHADIGPTGTWGNPINAKAFRRWPDYPISIWDHADFLHPDVVLIDGRFRAACWLTVQYRITRPTTVLFDDYIDRPSYHHVEQIAKPVEIVGRMARFELTPRPFPVERLGWIMGNYLRPQ